jgi:hypothetical protein
MLVYMTISPHYLHKKIFVDHLMRQLEPDHVPSCFHGIQDSAYTGKVKLSHCFLPDPFYYHLALDRVQECGKTGRTLSQRQDLRDTVEGELTDGSSNS